ncbi:MAG: hypothetical protein DHS20C13_28070 [Thermodesulfobacteriota bacterium]|nr:MAG: hypothetical protein DHS20C13_28070 [Thermodesulfobacteriota bacterium]
MSYNAGTNTLTFDSTYVLGSFDFTLTATNDTIVDSGETFAVTANGATITNGTVTVDGTTFDTETVTINDVDAVTPPPSSDDDFVYDEVTNADRIPDGLSSQENRSYENFLAADGAVLDFLDSVNEAIEENVIDEARLAGGEGLWDIAGIKGFAVSFSLSELNPGTEADLSLFPLRVGGIEAEAQDQLIVKSILRDRTLFLEVDYSITTDPNLSAIRVSVQQLDGSPLPEWLRVDDNGGLISGEPPVGTEDIKLRIEVSLSDDTKIVRYVDVNVNSGEIASLQQIGSEIIAGSSLFENQIEKEAVKFDNTSKDIENLFIN